MVSVKKNIPFSILIALSVVFGSGALLLTNCSKPVRFADDFERFKQDSLSNPNPGGIVCVGSSSMGKWDSRMREDLSPLTVISRGFGGSMFSDVNDHFHELITINQPRAILLYEGDNDSAKGKSLEEIIEDFETFRSKVTALNPDLRVYVIGVKPCTKHWEIWPFVCEVNLALKKICEADPYYSYIDMGEALLDADGQTQTELYQEDGVHLSDAGYDLWAGAVKALLLPR